MNKGQKGINFIDENEITKKKNGKHELQNSNRRKIV